jgi:Protein of unknown function (DUF512)
MYEDGIGMARAFEAELHGAGAGDRDGRRVAADDPDRGDFFRSADASLSTVSTNPSPGAHRRGTGAPSAGCGSVGVAPGAAAERADGSGSTGADYEPYRAVRATTDQLLRIGPSRRAPVAILTAPYGARVLEPLLADLGRPDVRVVTVDNRFFGGNVAVSGLMVGDDLARVLADQPQGHRYLLPDVCLTQGRFLDGTTPEDLPRAVEIVPTDGRALRAALESGG